MTASFSLISHICVTQFAVQTQQTNKNHPKKANKKLSLTNEHDGTPRHAIRIILDFRPKKIYRHRKLDDGGWSGAWSFRCSHSSYGQMHTPLNAVNGKCFIFIIAVVTHFCCCPIVPLDRVSVVPSTSLTHRQSTVWVWLWVSVFECVATCHLQHTHECWPISQHAIFSFLNALRVSKNRNKRIEQKNNVWTNKKQREKNT